MPNIYRVNASENEDNFEKYKEYQVERRGKKAPPPKNKPNSKNKKKKPDFKTLKNNTIKSLNDVEYFLNNFDNFMKYVKLYKLLK